MSDKKNIVENLFEPLSTEPTVSFDSDIDRLTEEYRKQFNTGWSLAEAFLCILISAAIADGVVVKEELDEIHALAYRSRILRLLTPSQLATANHELRDRLARRPDGLQEACDALPQEMRLSVFAHCVDIILADRELRPSEEEFLQKLVNRLKIPQGDATWVLQVMLIKNRF